MISTESGANGDGPVVGPHPGLGRLSVLGERFGWRSDPKAR
jgi:hypothetical protein